MPEQRPARPERRYLGIGVLAGLGLIALAAGLVWGAATGRHTAPPTGAASPSSRAAVTTEPSLLGEPEQDQYRAAAVMVTPEKNGALVSWQAPKRTDRVALFVIIAELNSRSLAQQEVGSGGRSVAFTGLAGRQDYCFVVATIVEQDSGAAGMTVTQPVCAVTGAASG